MTGWMQMNAIGRLRAALAAFLAAFLGGPFATAEPVLAEADQQCLACHATEGMSKRVDGNAFTKSVHAANGCVSCHGEVDLKKHPGEAKSQRAADACKGCHAEIFEAYKTSLHGRSRTQGDSSPAPVCATCHTSHQVDRASIGTHLRDTCLACHAGAPAAHAKWLPNTKRHFDTVSCAACHSPGMQRRIDLRLFDADARAEATGLPTPGDKATPLDSHGLREVVQFANLAHGGKVTLVGRLEARTAVDAHRLADKGKAVKDCASCHRKGAEAFQNVTLSFIGPEGKRVRYEAKKEVLHGATSVDSVRGFYAMGGTRIQVLDVLLGLALAGGISAPLGHAIVRKVMRRKEAKK